MAEDKDLKPIKAEEQDAAEISDEELNQVSGGAKKEKK